MHHVLVFGAGKIGSLIAFLLAKSGDFTVYLADLSPTQLNAPKELPPHYHYVSLDANDNHAVTDFIQHHAICALISSLPYYCNSAIATFAATHQLHYFDLTEDIAVSNTVLEIASHCKQAFVPQCGLAPGFINIITHHLMTEFSQLDTVKMRVGALPVNVSNALQYALTWSTEGLINEYGNPCHAIQDGRLVNLMPLEGLENINIDGLIYEAFNTSGGAGTLTKTYAGKVNHLDYKSIRYPGHCEKIKFLMNELRLNDDRSTLRRILENALPTTLQDVVLVYASVTGKRHNQWEEQNYVRKFYSHDIDGQHWSAIQLTTASSICTIVDLVLTQPDRYQGFIKQEQFSYSAFIKNRFGKPIYGTLGILAS